MTPRRENFGIRLPIELIDSLDCKARATGQTKTEIVETALRAALGLPSEPSIEQRLAAVEQRLGRIEATLGGLPEATESAPRLRLNVQTQNEPTENPTVPPETTKNVPQGDDGLQLIEALFAAGLADVQWPKLRRLSPAQIQGPNLSQLLRARGQGSAADWLRGQGWQSIDGLWHSPSKECEPQ